MASDALSKAQADVSMTHSKAVIDGLKDFDARLALYDQALGRLDFQAKQKMEWADSVNAKANYSDAYRQGPNRSREGRKQLQRRRFQRFDRPFEGGAERPRPRPGPGALAALLRRASDTRPRGCYWRIAAYPFVYNNPLLWPKLYAANKAKMNTRTIRTLSIRA